MGKGVSDPKTGFARALTSQQVAAMEQAADDPRHALFVRLLYETGARIGEMIELKPGAINRTDGTLRLLNEKHGKGAEKYPALQAETLGQLEDYCRSNAIRRDEYVFPGRSKSQHISLRMARQWFYTLAITADVTMQRPRDGAYVPAWPHTARHGCASQMIRDGVNLLGIQDHLGHSRLATTEIYLHIVNPDKRRDIEKVRFRPS